MLKGELNRTFPGIYGIFTGEDICLYTGGGKEVNDCYSRHKSNLDKNKYANTNKSKIQEIYNTGEDLYFKVLEECSPNITPKELSKKEAYYISLYNNTNVNKDRNGKRRSSKPTPEETKKRRAANVGTNNPNNKHDLDTIIEIKMMIQMGLSNKEIERKTGINDGYISQIRTGQKWGHIQLPPI